MAYHSCNKCSETNWLINDLTCELKIAAFSKNDELSIFAKKLLSSIGDFENVRFKDSRNDGNYV